MTGTYTRRLDFVRTALEQAGGRPLTYSELAARGIADPAQAIYELELEGEAVMHVPGGVALAPRSAVGRSSTEGRRRTRSRSDRRPPTEPEDATTA